MSRSPGHAWIIGASQGIGRELAGVLAAQGWRLTLSARNEQRLAEVSETCGATPVAFDATDREATLAAATRVFSAQPCVLVVVNVGDYQPMPLKEFDADLFVSLNRANYLASVFVLDAVIPLMRTADGGQILLNASAAGYRGLPNSAPYSAPKAATVHMAESLAPELAREGIRLRVINHGFVKSRLTDKNAFNMPFLMEARDAAERIAAAISGNAFEITFPRRLTWPMKWLRCLPYRLYFAIVNRWVLP